MKKGNQTWAEKTGFLPSMNNCETQNLTNDMPFGGELFTLEH